MFRLSKLGFLTSRLLYLKDDVPLCYSQMFGRASGRQWMTKGKKSESIGKETINKPGSGVSVDQIQSDQEELVSQFSGKFISAHI